MQYTSQTGFSIIIALGFMLLMSSIGLYLLEYMIPFSRNTKGIENASKAYYQSYAGVEDALLYSFSGGLGTEPVDPLSGVIDFAYRTFASGTVIPQPGRGNSELDSDWNTISQGKSIQLSIGNGMITSSANSVRLSLRVPDFDGLSTVDALNTSPNDEMILWQLSSNTESTSSLSGTLITELGINGGGIYDIWSSFHGRGVLTDGRDETDGVSADFDNFYFIHCGSGNECTLKISVINPIVSNVGGKILPYLEYQLFTSQAIPTQYADIMSTGQSVGFKKNLEVSVLQQNTNAAFDFAVFQ